MLKYYSLLCVLISQINLLTYLINYVILKTESFVNRGNIMINVVVVCWNALEYTINTLNSLLETIKTRKDVKLTIINNGSTDGTYDFLVKFVRKIKISAKVINNELNIGIGAAYNQGLQESINSNSRYTVFCNNDLLFTKNWVSKMKKIMDNNSNIAMLSPIVPSSSSFYDGTRTIKDVLLSLKKDLPIKEEIVCFIGESRNIDEFQNKICKYNMQIYNANLRMIKFPNAISSCIVMTRTSIFKEIGFFANPEFKEYGGEDIDMCWRVMKRGFDIAVTNEVYIHHFRGKSIKAANLDRAKLIKKSNIKLFKIWKSDIAKYYKDKGIFNPDEIPNTPENWLINELKNDINLKEVLKNEI